MEVDQPVPENVPAANLGPPANAGVVILQLGGIAVKIHEELDKLVLRLGPRIFDHIRNNIQIAPAAGGAAPAPAFDGAVPIFQPGPENAPAVGGAVPPEAPAVDQPAPENAAAVNGGMVILEFHNRVVAFPEKLLRLAIHFLPPIFDHIEANIQIAPGIGGAVPQEVPVDDQPWPGNRPAADPLLENAPAADPLPGNAQAVVNVGIGEHNVEFPAVLGDLAEALRPEILALIEERRRVGQIILDYF